MEESNTISYICRQCDGLRLTGSISESISNNLRIPCDHCFPRGMWRLTGKRVEARLRDVRTAPTNPTHFVFDYQCRRCGVQASNTHRIKIPGTHLENDPEPRRETCLNCYPGAMWQVIDFGDQFEQPEVFGSELRQTQANERQQTRNLTPIVQVSGQQDGAGSRTLSTDVVPNVRPGPGDLPYQPEERPNNTPESQNQVSNPRLRQYVTSDAWKRCDGDEDRRQQISVLEATNFYEPTTWSVDGDLGLQGQPLDLDYLLAPKGQGTYPVDRAFWEQMTIIPPSIGRPDLPGRNRVPHAGRRNVPTEPVFPTLNPGWDRYNPWMGTPSASRPLSSGCISPLQRVGDEMISEDLHIAALPTAPGPAHHRTRPFEGDGY